MYNTSTIMHLKYIIYNKITTNKNSFFEKKSCMLHMVQLINNGKEREINNCIRTTSALKRRNNLRLKVERTPK